MYFVTGVNLDKHNQLYKELKGMFDNSINMCYFDIKFNISKI